MATVTVGWMVGFGAGGMKVKEGQSSPASQGTTGSYI